LTNFTAINPSTFEFIYVVEVRSWDPPAVETRKHLLADPQKAA